MQFLHADRRDIDLRAYKRAAVASDCSTLVTNTTTVQVEGRTVAVYYTNLRDPIIDQIRAVLPTVRTEKNTRTGGLQTNSRIFGYAPRNEIRKHPCRAVRLAAEQPVAHAIIASGAEVVGRYYEESMPEVAAAHRKVTSELVKPEYMIGSSMFTSGIVNKNNPLQYHFDAGNFGNCCSAMLGFKTDTVGGELCVPELDLRFEISDRSLLLFDGQGLLHGVTPIQLTSQRAMRFTVVYYALKQMWNCETINDELVRQRQRRLEVERNQRARKK